MKIGILGTGMVGKTLGGRFLELDHQVMLGGRSADGGADWAAEKGEQATSEDFAEAAAFGDIALIAVSGAVARDVARSAADALKGKILIDVTNPLDFSQGFPPSLLEGLTNTYSLGEALQDALPETHVVKSFNTMANAIMVAPGALSQPADIFLAGNDSGAKAEVAGLLAEMGWTVPIDMAGSKPRAGLRPIFSSGRGPWGPWVAMECST